LLISSFVIAFVLHAAVCQLD